MTRKQKYIHVLKCELGTPDRRRNREYYEFHDKAYWFVFGLLCVATVGIAIVVLS